MKIAIEELKYPTGKFNWPKEINKELITEWINDIEKFPALLKSEVENLNDEELAFIYRPEGWNIRQVVHHCADSHSNAFARFKLALTEEKPIIKPYLENLWSQLPDVTNAPVEWSFEILIGLHKRWVLLMRNMSNDDWKKCFVHPEHGRELKLESTVALYAWHCNHHLSHVKQAKNFSGKF
ncbi:putative metal-dependent hydrolase [Bacteroidota bacterium]|nr:putative metal-dependent hydrolase [Bacteroidota bacterium]